MKSNNKHMMNNKLQRTYYKHHTIHVKHRNIHNIHTPDNKACTMHMARQLNYDETKTSYTIYKRKYTLEQIHIILRKP